MGNPNRHLTKQKPSRRTDDEHRRIHNIIRTPEPTYRTAATHSDLVLYHLHHHPPTVTGVEWCVCQQKYEARIILSHNSTQWLVVWWASGRGEAPAKHTECGKLLKLNCQAWHDEKGKKRVLQTPEEMFE